MPGGVFSGGVPAQYNADGPMRPGEWREIGAKGVTKSYSGVTKSYSEEVLISIDFILSRLKEVEACVSGIESKWLHCEPPKELADSPNKIYINTGMEIKEKLITLGGIADRLAVATSRIRQSL